MKLTLNMIFLVMLSTLFNKATGQKNETVKVVKDQKSYKVDVFIGQKLFTSFLYPDTLEKPVLYPLHAANGTVVTRGFPINPRSAEPVDHPHHIGMWLTYENVN